MSNETTQYSMHYLLVVLLLMKFRDPDEVHATSTSLPC